MENIIKLLPDNVANQIAAGEVINRPASVLKELLENSIDAGATAIKVLIEEGGKKLIQVVDDGIGMTVQDARLSLERHSTSKIDSFQDLNRLSTYGFRGEALASIVSVAQVKIKTKQASNEIGVALDVSASEVTNQVSIPGPDGTSIAVRNLFYNVPARKKFLKSDTTELKYLLDEFFHVALAYPETSFEVFNNGSQLFKLHSSNLNQRIIQLFGTRLQNKLFWVEEEGPNLRLSGYIGKSDTAKKKRGDQYLFLNNRFIKNHYLNHAVKSAYGSLLPEKAQPFYVLHLELDPSTIDVNVHPTKQEVKFENDKIIYDIVKTSIMHSLSMFQEVPSLDFETNNEAFSSARNTSKGFAVESSFSGLGSGSTTSARKEQAAWNDLYDDLKTTRLDTDRRESPAMPFPSTEESFDSALPILVKQGYIFSYYRDKMVVVDQYRMHYKINYTDLLDQKKSEGIAAQTQLFPLTFDLEAKDYAQVLQNQSRLAEAGIEVNDFGQQTIIVNSLPKVLHHSEGIKELILSIAEESQNEEELNKDLNKIARAAAYQKNKNLSTEEIKHLLSRLFTLPDARFAPNGKQIFTELDKDLLASLLEK